MGAVMVYEYIEKRFLKKGVKEAHDRLFKAALLDHGHRGYTGSIAEKPEFLLFTLRNEYKHLLPDDLESLLKDDSPEGFLNNLFEECGSYDVIYDKWGPILAFATDSYYCFYGLASC